MSRSICRANQIHVNPDFAPSRDSVMIYGNKKDSYTLDNKGRKY